MTVIRELTNADDVFVGDFNDERILCKGGNDRVSGLNGQDEIEGGTGNDILSGGNGDDSLHGGEFLVAGLFSGDDFLFGDAGNDTLDGSSGDDSLNGGADNDTLIGGTGSDRFVFGSGSVFDITDFGVDTIKDFDPKSTLLSPNEDKIVLDKTSFTALSNGLSFTKVTKDSDADDVSARIVYNINNGRLFYNPNGNASGFANTATGGGHFATLTDAPTISATNFSLIA